MKDLAAFSLAGGGGFGILVSYILIWLYGVFSVHLSYIKSNILKYFLGLFIVLSIVSFLYIVAYVSFETKLNSNRDLFFIGLIFYIVGSCTWSIIAAYIEIKNYNPDIQYFSLILTAVGIILITISTYDEDDDFIKVSLIILLIQHVFVDLVLWPIMHKRGWKEKNLKNKKLKVKT